MKKQLSKTASLRRHAKRRAIQRFGVDLNRNDLKVIISGIQASPPKYEFVDRQSNRITRWLVELAGRKAIVVYDSTRKQIVTFLNLEEVKT